ncbi:ABC transporter substrate-binding protein [Phytoactinopolyspora halotolerans]|uniref:ABC transporter substrate-binding protein n=1 Tax=Phytoactinopolyspora halotolerans TaxID=1981512 RepID=A0A6L9SKF9_9ACTN|nr:ABC transporter substrate-binding protein [Phytoactinopolyspora halotolerans]NEE04560.1 ABC transporter substrate-binding protein [Phytoactinopolyspora halotolerans]
MPKRSVGRTTGSALMVGALLVASACSSEGGGSASPQGDATLVFGVPQPPNSLDPAELHDGVQRYVWGALFDTLLYLDHEGELQPAAAESWEYSDDALTLTLHLRDDLSFSDSEPVRAEDVRGTLERTRTTPGPQQGNLSAIDSIEVPDDHTVVLNLSEPDDNLLTSLAQAAGVVGDPETLDDPQTQLNPVGSGPYTLNADQTDDGVVYVLDRRDDHWNAEEYPFETVTVRPITDQTARFNAMIAGELDAATVNGELAERAVDAGLSLTEVEGASLAQIVLADRDGEVVPALGDVRVRQAINMALDRAGMVESLNYGFGVPTAQVFNPLSSAYLPEGEQAYPYDVEAARELMAEAGYGDGFTLAMPANVMSMQFQATLSQAFADIGITLQWDPVPAQSSGQSTDWAAYWNIGGAAPSSRVVAQYFAPEGSNNPFGSSDPELNELIEDVAAEVDLGEADELYSRINQFGIDNAWFSPALWLDTIWATVEGVEYVGSALSMQDLRVFDVSE